MLSQLGRYPIISEEPMPPLKKIQDFYASYQKLLFLQLQNPEGVF